MPSINKIFIEKVIERSKSNPEDLVSIIGEFAGQPRREGASYKAACPLCGGEHSLVITPGKRIFKCFNCNELTGKYPLDYLMKGQGMSYPDAIEWLANHYGMIVEYDEPVRRKAPAKKKSEGASQDHSFCKSMLTASGLTYKDVTAQIMEGDTMVERKTFRPGTLTKDGFIDENGDDAVILYYDLDGKQAKYTVTMGAKEVEKYYVRVRYQFPDQHLDKNKRSVKYRSPTGAPTFIYYPQLIRNSYQHHLDIPVLYIQEGEKKAEKACKHGIPSIAVSGIQNIGYKGSLPDDIIKLVEVCHVSTVIFMLDADCFDLSKNLTVDDPVERRPKNFFYAIKNFKEYFARLKNYNLFPELYFGYIKKDVTPDKGTDDILANTLAGKEQELLEDLEKTRNEKSGDGKWVKLHKITTISDSKLQEIWSLQSVHDFCKKYYEQLKNMPEFTYGHRRLCFNESGELESTQPLENDEKFWVETKKKDNVEYNFCYVGAKKFLEHRGFFRYKKPNGEYEFIHIENHISKVVRPYEVGDYIRSFTQDFLAKPVLEMIYKGGAQYLGPNSLTMLDFFSGAFEKSTITSERLYFAEKIWLVTRDGVKVTDYTQLHDHIWNEQKKLFSAEYVGNLIEIKPVVHERETETGTEKYDTFEYTLTPAGKKCDFLRFLENASNFTWRKDSLTQMEKDANAHHLISKLAAFGYLVATTKDEACAKAIISMDGKQSEIGVSNGRSGKSILGEAVKQVVSTRYYNGKAFTAGANNPHVWDGITEKTRAVIIDDCQKDFDFENMFSLITGEWPVNPKGEAPFTLPFSISPKVYITTNHAISGDGASFEDRQWPIAFSDFYNQTHKPKDDFRTRFFSEWDFEQWNLFWNLVAQCLIIYYTYGYVPAPGDRLEKRKLLQEVNEEFALWADEYFSPDKPGSCINQRKTRKEIYQALLDYVGPKRGSYYSPKVFKNKIIKYCKLRDLIFNPQMFDPNEKVYVKVDADGRPKLDDKSNGVEYMTVGNEDFYNQNPSVFENAVTDADIQTGLAAPIADLEEYEK